MSNKPRYPQEPYHILDISQPVTSSSACFPGDTPFSRKITVSFEESKVINLTAMTLSPHIGTHADAASHISGKLADSPDTAGLLPLAPYLGPVTVIDIAPFHDEIKVEHLPDQPNNATDFPKRLLFKTQTQIRYDVFENAYAYFSPKLIQYLAKKRVSLLGIDTPSVDHINSKSLAVHHELTSSSIAWLENLDLTQVSAGNYFLIALPLKFMELEATPVRAVLLSE